MFWHFIGWLKSYVESQVPVTGNQWPKVIKIIFCEYLVFFAQKLKSIKFYASKKSTRI